MPFSLVYVTGLRACLPVQPICGVLGAHLTGLTRSLQIKSRMQELYQECGVCFCGAEVIGKDLAKMCTKYSSVKGDERYMFHLHKENF